MRPGQHPILEPEPQRRIPLNARRLSFQPTIPPTDAFLEKADRRARHPPMGIEMAPGAYQALTGNREIFHEAEHSGRIAIGPAADAQHGTSDRRVVLAHRAMAPEGIAALMLEPERRKRA